MYIEDKSHGIVGPARIGWVTFSKSGQSIDYRGRRFARIKGGGLKSNYRDVVSGEEYWISGCKKDGNDALYSTSIEIDEDAREEYWVRLRRMPENINRSTLPRKGKYPSG
jgi:hypothetical protein